MNNMTYEENLRKTAEELGELQYHLEVLKICPALSDWKCLSQHTKNHWSDQFIEMAEYCVRKQAEAYVKGLETVLPIEFVQHNADKINKSLQELGLIP